jgi:large subunit ribosomal protein L25
MSATKFELIAVNREVKGKLACRRLRNAENQVPAIVYGGKEQNLSITLSHDKVLQIAEHENFYSKILNLIIDGQTQKVVLKDLQRHPFKPKILHLDFQRVKETDVLAMQVPLHFVNADKCPGAKLGGLINHHANVIEVRCEARFLPEFLEVDLSELQLGQSIHLSNLQLPEHVEILPLAQGKLDSPVASVQLPKAAAEEEAFNNTEATGTNIEEKEAKEKELKDKNKTAAQTAQKTAGNPKQTKK